LEARMDLRIVNPDPKYSTVTLIPPATLGYVHLAAEVRPPPRPGPVIRTPRQKAELIGGLKVLARQLEPVAGVEKVTIYTATVMAPPSGYVRQHKDQVRPARFDIVVLVETTTPEAAREVQATSQYQALHDLLRGQARRLHVIAARNLKRVGDVDKTRSGTFLFNYFVGDDPEVVVALWDYLGGWYQTETGLDNSTLLAPLEDQASDYVVINHARWDSLLGFAVRQFRKKSFRTYVVANLDAHNVGAMPILYRLA
jgi:hypothetical protein